MKKTYLLNKIKSIKSKLQLQNHILEIAKVYSNSIIYFPVRLDNRGRSYCKPTYFNYQSTELAKALLLFSNPGIISKNDEESINYFKVR